jgi:hypothetical protein
MNVKIIQFFLLTIPCSMHWRQTESYMHRAGFTKTRSHPPLQNFAKADNQKTLEARPHGV